MGMMPFFTLFPEIAKRETKIATVPPGGQLPPDTYAFFDLYCVDPRCDCRRVLVNVLAQTTGRHVATINHAFDAANADEDLGQTYLDPLNPQTRWAEDFRTLFLMLLREPDYVARLERHYRMVKDAVDDPANPDHQRIVGLRGDGDERKPAGRRWGRPVRRRRRR